MIYTGIFRTLIAATAAVAVVFTTVGPGTARAQGPSIGPDQDRALELRAQGLEKQLICPICPGETLDQSFVQISQDMKRILREKLFAGEDEQQIKDFFVARYGISVLAAPPRSGFNLVTWLLPPIALAFGVVGLLFVLRAMRRKDGDPLAAEAGVSIAEERLSDYLDEVDRDLSLDAGTTPDATDATDAPPDRDPGDPASGRSAAG